MLLQESGLVTACMDTSDGLLATIRQLCESNRLGATVVEANVPINAVVRRVAEFLGIAPLRLAASASVDFRLVFTASEPNRERLRNLLMKGGIVAHDIGWFHDNVGLFRVDESGNTTRFEGVEWQQQSADPLLALFGA